MTSDGPERVAEPLERAALAVLATACVVILLLQLSAGIAGVLFGHGWAAGSFSDMPTVVARLVHRLDDPRRAWPPPQRADLPGPVAFYASTGTVFAAAGFAVAGAVRVFRGRRSRGADWARRAQLRALVVRSPVRSRVTLGRHRGRLLAAERHQSLLVIAPTQSGKTTALAVPAILEWDGPVLAVSVKTDLLRDTIGHRASLGDVSVFDPTDSTSLAVTASWTPLAQCRTWAGARKVARWMADAASSDQRGLSDSSYWYSAAAKLLAPILFAAASSGVTMEEVVAWLDTREERAVLLSLEAADDRQALHAMQASWAQDDRQRSSIYTTAETVLEAYADPGVLAHSALPEIRADRLLDGSRATLYLCASAREQRRLRPVFVALIEEILEAAYEKAGRQGHPLDPPLLVVLDEVANIAPLPDLDVLVSTSASHGVQIITVLQDLAQAQARWGRERADTLLNNHRARMLGAGLADERALDWLTRLLGEEELIQRSTTVDGSGRRSVTESTLRRSLAPANLVREAMAGSALLVYGNLPPAWLKLRPWYREPSLRRLAEPHSRSMRR